MFAYFRITLSPAVYQLVFCLIFFFFTVFWEEGTR